MCSTFDESKMGKKVTANGRVEETKTKIASQVKAK